MDVDHEAMEAKKRELVGIALQVIPVDVTNRAAIAEQIVRGFADVTPPIAEPPRYELITFRSGGRHGGTSRKPGNITMTWTRVLTLVTTVAINGAAAASGPWLVPFVALHIWITIRNVTAKELTPRHAMTLFAMWQHRDGHHRIPEDVGLAVANEYLSRNGFPNLSQREFVDIVDDLCTADCVEVEAGIVWLREWVRSSY